MSWNKCVIISDNIKQGGEVPATRCGHSFQKVDKETAIMWGGVHIPGDSNANLRSDRGNWSDKDMITDGQGMLYVFDSMLCVRLTFPKKKFKLSEPLNDGFLISVTLLYLTCIY